MQDQLLHWDLKNIQLNLSGKLENKTLQPLWNKRREIMQHVEIIDLSALENVDSAGLALLVHLSQTGLKYDKKTRFIGIRKKLYALIKLYNLQNIINESI